MRNKSCFKLVIRLYFLTDTPPMEHVPLETKENPRHPFNLLNPRSISR